MATYDKHYRKEHYFGKPYAVLMQFFDQSARGTLVDLGAGQGRDSIALAEMGYQVSAVDISDVGLAQIRRANPAIQTVNADLHSFDVTPFDYVLLDSILHFYAKDIDTETALVRSILTQLHPGATFVNCLLKSTAAEKKLKLIIGEFPADIIFEEYAGYPEFHASYHLLAVQKTGGMG